MQISLEDHLQKKVKITSKDGEKGTIVIDFYSKDEPRLIWIGIYFRGLHLNNLVKSFFLNEKRHSYALPLLFFSVIIPLLFSGKCQNKITSKDGEKGTIVIDFYSKDELADLADRLTCY